jgi:hypothetical protein
VHVRVLGAIGEGVDVVKLEAAALGLDDVVDMVPVLDHLVPAPLPMHVVPQVHMRAVAGGVEVLGDWEDAAVTGHLTGHSMVRVQASRRQPPGHDVWEREERSPS